MEKVMAWVIILGSIYGFVLLVINAVYAVMRLWDFIKTRRNHDGH